MDHHMSALRVLNYFAVDSGGTDGDVNVDDADTSARPFLRAGAHTDYGALTILKSGGPGLQVKKDMGGGKDFDKDTHEWVDVPDLPNSYIINLGDLMQQWTNGTHTYLGVVEFVFVYHAECIVFTLLVDSRW
jgi:isopenicillin N synthase-like dioxygenase